jgi:hypothetical protein
MYTVQYMLEVLLLCNPRVRLLILECDGSMILQNNANHSPNDKASHPRRPESSVY